MVNGYFQKGISLPFSVLLLWLKGLNSVSKFFTLQTPVWKGYVVWGSKQEVTKVVLLYKNGRKNRGMKKDLNWQIIMSVLSHTHKTCANTFLV